MAVLVAPVSVLAAVLLGGLAARSWSAGRARARLSGGHGATFPSSRPGQLSGLVERWRWRRTGHGALSDVLDDVARGLRGGLGLAGALQRAAAGAPPQLGLQPVVRAWQAGQPLAVSLQRWARGSPHPGARLAAAALVVGASTGGAHARALDGVAASLRDEQAMRREVRALTSQARASAAVITVAPLAFLAFSALTDARVAGFLATPLGWMVLAGGLALDGVAGLWMARICRDVW